jgi:hypothetical protein
VIDREQADSGEGKMTAAFLGAQSLCLCISVFFFRKSGMHNALVLQDTRDFQQLPVVKLCAERPMQLLCSFVPECFCSGFSLHNEIAMMQLCKL